MKRAEKKALKAKLKAMTFQEKREYYKSKRIGWRQAWYIIKWALAGFGAFVVTCLIIMIVQINQPDPVVTKAAPKPTIKQTAVVKPKKIENGDWRGWIDQEVAKNIPLEDKIADAHEYGSTGIEFTSAMTDGLMPTWQQDTVYNYEADYTMGNIGKDAKPDEKEILTHEFEAVEAEKNSSGLYQEFVQDYYMAIWEKYSSPKNLAELKQSWPDPEGFMKQHNDEFLKKYRHITKSTYAEDGLTIK